MSNIKPFTPKAGLKAEAQLDRFINWAKGTAEKSRTLEGGRLHESFSWDDAGWHQYNVESVAFTKLESTRSNRIDMEAPFVDFAKAVVVERTIFHRIKKPRDSLDALRALDSALSDIGNGVAVTKTKAEHCNKALELMQSSLSFRRAYNASLALQKIINLMRDGQLLEVDFTWKSPLRSPKKGTLKQQEKDAQKKLPSDDALKALGEIFNQSDLSDLDAVVTSACALLLSVPARIGELADLPHDCLFYKENEANGEPQMFLRWRAEKVKEKKKYLPKAVNTGMDPAVERALELLKPVTSEAREYAKWLEDNPDTFPPHDGVPNKDPDEPLTYAEMRSALMIDPREESERSKFRDEFLIPLAKMKALNEEAKTLLNEILAQWDQTKGKRVSQVGRTYETVFTDRTITLRDLNVLMRARYLPKHFPYTTPMEDGKTRIKFSEALFTVRTGAMAEGSGTASPKKPFGLEIGASNQRISVQLSGGERKISIFERHGYDGLKANSHQFRHYINTEMHRAGLSQDLIDLFSGRDSMGSVYNHESIQERTDRVELYHPETRSSSQTALEKIQTKQPLNLSDVTDLHGAENRVIHQTHLGLCVHNFAETPCPKMGACLTCGLLGCVKGDDTKLANLKNERVALNETYERALKAKENGAVGAERWFKKATDDLAKCDALIGVLEDPDTENGAIVWNQDNGWNLTNNAAVMGGLIPLEQVEAEIEDAALPSLSDLLESNKAGG